MKTIIKKTVVVLVSILIFQSFISDNMTPNILPIEKSKIKVAVGFGYRIHPIYKVKKFHYGVDLFAKEGTPIRATADGVIDFAISDSTKYGNNIRIKHNSEYETFYAHLKDLKVIKGEKIKQGQIIGTVGNTGLSAKPHLHYEIVKNGKRVDPSDYFEL